MIHLLGVTKAYHTTVGVKTVLHPTYLSLPTHRHIGVLGENGSGKTTLINMIAGVETPDAGRIVRDCTISWPLGFSGGMHADMTGAEGCRFTARIYGVDEDSVVEFVYDFSELGDDLFLPIRTYSSGMRARLAFGVSMAIDFDCYLVDELTAVGDAPFQAKCRRAFAERRDRSGLLIVSHSERTIRNFCDSALVLRSGHLVPFDDLNEAIAFYKSERVS